MAQTFYPYRFAFALVLSVVLVLSVTQLTQAKTAHRTQRYPSQVEAEAAISQYYEHENAFSRKSTMLHFDSLTYRPVYSVLKPSYSNPEDQKKFDGFAEWWRFDVCAQYQFTSVPLPEAKQTARHIFTFENTYTDTWNVIGMGLQSC